MARKGENIYKRKDGRWEGRVIQSEGKYRYYYAKTYREVREKMKNSCDTEATPIMKVQQSKENAADLFNNWLLNDSLNQLKPSTFESYYYCMKSYVIPYFSQPQNTLLCEKTITAFVQSIHNNQELSVTYQKKILSIFKTALKAIFIKTPKNQLLIDKVILPKVKYSLTEVPVFSLKEQRLLEYTVQNSKDERMLGIVLCFYTGIRLGELCALKWGDFDFDAGTMSIRRSVSRVRNFESEGAKTKLSIGTPKSCTSCRKIPIPAFFYKQVKDKNMIPKAENYYILSSGTEPFDPRAYQRLYKKMLVESGVRNRKFHALRHTFATRALELGVDLKTLSEILGHSNVNITLNVYAHSLMEQKKKAIEKMNELYFTHEENKAFAVNSAVINTNTAV